MEFDGADTLLLARLIGVENPEDIRIGMPVEVVFEVVSPQVSLPKFRPVR